MAGGNEPKAKPRARILIVDDHPVVREGLTAQITAQGGMEVCGEADDVADAVALHARSKPDVTVVDISLKSGNGLDLIKRLRARDKEARIVVWSMYPEALYAERALRAGAMAYVHKGRATRQIIQAIRAVLSGRPYLSDDLSAQLLRRLVGSGTGEAERSPVEMLSDRELETFKLMGEGLTTEQIAERMHVSPKTVETYRSRIKDKLGVTHITELIRAPAQWVLQSG